MRDFSKPCKSAIERGTIEKSSFLRNATLSRVSSSLSNNSKKENNNLCKMRTGSAFVDLDKKNAIDIKKFAEDMLDNHFRKCWKNDPVKIPQPGQFFRFKYTVYTCVHYL